ncbi:hypothetical protein Zmor_025918 [Zophobas morio]|uniref:Peptidase S1 domain-containing protein n=1 Tax=Zophobas morio TaxID=2755281 RepID=A0AA38M4P8_9CUCU|nr:hypothetical protein Zmor_025918 [Zophobas morio]
MKFVIVLSLCIISIWGVPLAQKRDFAIRKHHNDLRIIGGNVATAGQFPWDVAIFVESESSSFFCGGALIDQKWVLTGGRCVYGATSFELLFGTISLENGGIVREATYSVTHPDFNLETLENDIGLIRIDDSINLSDKIKIIPIANTNLESDVTVTASGWGALGTSGGIENKLNYVDLKTITNNECKFSYGVLVPDQMVCAMGNRNNGICSGDSGDPLIMKDSSGNAVHVGVASWSSAGGCLTSQPSTYTRTASYKYWIISVIAENV